MYIEYKMSTIPKNNFAKEQKNEPVPMLITQEELKSEKNETKEVELFFKEIEEKGNEIYEKQLLQK